MFNDFFNFFHITFNGIFLILVILGELYYWGVYFPKVWKNGSNHQINEIKTVIKTVYGRRK